MARKLLFVAAMLAMFGMATAQAQTSNVQVTREGKTFTAHKAQTTKGSGYKATGYTYVDTDGKAYEIHTHTTQKGKNKGQAKCYIQRTSKKTGKPYWKQIPVKPEDLN